jgi:hypothetical protein
MTGWVFIRGLVDVLDNGPLRGKGGKGCGMGDGRVTCLNTGYAVVWV